MGQDSDLWCVLVSGTSAQGVCLEAESRGTDLSLSPPLLGFLDFVLSTQSVGCVLGSRQSLGVLAGERSKRQHQSLFPFSYTGVSLALGVVGGFLLAMMLCYIVYLAHWWVSGEHCNTAQVLECMAKGFQNDASTERRVCDPGSRLKC